MTRETRIGTTAVGFRVKSGWASAVLVAGAIDAPQVLDRRRLELCDPDISESQQPYHASMGTLQTDEATVKRLRKVIVRAANRSVKELLSDFSTAGHEPRVAALVVGSKTDPAKITNPHIRAHALEGQLFRSVLEDALRANGLACLVIVERDVYAQAAGAFGRAENQLKRLLAKLGRALGPPWRGDEKIASLAAWLALAAA